VPFVQKRNEKIRTLYAYDFIDHGHDESFSLLKSVFYLVKGGKLDSVHLYKVVYLYTVRIVRKVEMRAAV